MYLIKTNIIVLWTCKTVLLILQSYMCLLDCRFVLYSFIYFACIYELINCFISQFRTHSVYLFVCVCVCVCVHEKKKRFYYAEWCQRFQRLRGTPKEGFMILGTPVGRECCITVYKQAVRTNVCAEQYFTTRSTAQYIHHFLPNIVDDNGDINIIYWSNYFHST